MFYNLPELHRKDRQISFEECEQILQDAEYLVMATAGKNGLPYAAPLSFVYFEGKIYFHSGRHQGHRAVNLAENPYCSLAVIGKTQPVYTKNFTTYYESVIIFGKVSEVTDSARKKTVLFALAEKYLPDFMVHAEHDINASLERTAVYEISLDNVTGKAKRARTET